MPDVTIEIKAGRTQEQKDKIAKINNRRRARRNRAVA